MKLQTKINIFLMAALSALTVFTILAGAMLIDKIVLHDNRQLLQLEVDMIKKEVEDAYNVLTTAGVITSPDYIKKAKQQLTERFHRMKFSMKTSNMFIFTGRGEIIYHTDFAPGRPFDFSFVREMLAKGDGVIEYTYKKRERFCVFRSFPEWGWIIALSVTKDEIFANRNLYIFQVSLIALVALLLILGVVRYFARSFTGRIETTLSCIKKIENGDLTARIRTINSGDEIGVLQHGINSMISSRENAEEALRESEVKYRSLFEHMFIGFAYHKIITDEDGRPVDYEFLEINDAFEKLTGLKREHVVGRRVTEVIPGIKDDDFDWIGNYGKIALGGGNLKFEQYAGALDTWYSIFAYSPERGYFVAMFDDITKRKQAEEALQKAKDEAETASIAKSHFLANMSHELRTPMNAVLGFADLLTTTPLNDVQRDYVETIDASGRVLLSLINDILDLSKIESGEIGLESTEFNLKELAESTLRIVRPKMEEDRVRLVFDISGGIPDRFTGDPTRIQQVILNLLSNAVKFTNRGEIRLSLSGVPAPYTFSEDGMYGITISVRDTGIGISEDKQKTIFDAFAQEDSSTTRKYGGTGLGLTIAKRLTECMGGRIKLISEKDEGSEFIVTLPLRAARSAGGAELAERGGPGMHGSKKTGRNPSSLEGLKVLVVEDNEDNAELVRIHLERFGCETDNAFNGQEAVRKAKEDQYDIIFMDIQMPLMNGIEATEIIRRDVNSEIPVIGLTAAVMGQDREKAMAAGMNDYLTKPIKSSRLKEVLLKWTRPGIG